MRSLKNPKKPNKKRGALLVLMKPCFHSSKLLKFNEIPLNKTFYQCYMAIKKKKKNVFNNDSFCCFWFLSITSEGARGKGGRCCRESLQDMRHVKHQKEKWTPNIETNRK